jgi:hypothetical protein
MIAAQAAELLAWFPATNLATSALLAIPETIGTELARASANLALGHLALPAPEVDQRLAALLTAEAYGVQLTAAVALAIRLYDQIPDTALQILIEARDNSDKITAGNFPIPWTRSLIGFASLALYRIGLSPYELVRDSGFRA